MRLYDPIRETDSDEPQPYDPDTGELRYPIWKADRYGRPTGDWTDRRGEHKFDRPVKGDTVVVDGQEFVVVWNGTSRDLTGVTVGRVRRRC